MKYIHRCKTAALLTASIRLGAMSANATPARLAALTDFGQALGLAFQVIDDILDVTQTTEKLGKTAGKDVAATKATYPAIFGLERSRREAHRLTAAAHAALEAVRQKRRHPPRPRRLPPRAGLLNQVPALCGWQRRADL